MQIKKVNVYFLLFVISFSTFLSTSYSRRTFFFVFFPVITSLTITYFKLVVRRFTIVIITIFFFS